jgi:hypothetical protein
VVLGPHSQASQDPRRELPTIAAIGEHFVESARASALAFLVRRRLRHEGDQNTPPESRFGADSSSEHGCVADFTQPDDYHMMLEQGTVIVRPLSRSGDEEPNVFEHRTLRKRIVARIHQKHRTSFRAICHDCILGHSLSQSSCQQS